MRRVMVNAFGGPEQLIAASMLEPLRPAPGQILVEVEAAGVNYIDLYQRNGIGNLLLRVLVVRAMGSRGWSESPRCLSLCAGAGAARRRLLRMIATTPYRMKAPNAMAAAAVLGAAVLLVSASGAAAQLFRETITLAGVVPDTGKFAVTGRGYRQAYQFAIDAINGQGGVAVGGRTYHLRLTLRDSKSDPKQTVTLYEKLLANAKATFALGPYTSIEALAASEVAQKRQVPMVTAGGGSGRIFSRGNGYVFGTLPPAEEYFVSTIAMLNELTPRVKTVAIVSGNGAAQRTDAMCHKRTNV